MAFFRPTPLAQGPTKPQIFFGRDAELAQIVQMITTNRGSCPARIAILGPGGYGKTTLAHAVLTVDVIREHFGKARCFVPCESITSSGALLTELGKTLGVVNSGSDALWSRILATLTSTESIICFDNFESPWDQHVEIRHSVEELLSRVTDSDFPARLGLKAGSTARHFGASGLRYLMPGPFFTASVSLGSSQPVSPGFLCLSACKPRPVC